MRLVDLCARPESRQSQFFNLFAPPLFLGPFGEHDFKELLVPFTERGIKFEPGVEKEVHNSSGGIPIIASYMSKLLWESHTAGGVVTRDQTLAAARRVGEVGKDVLKVLWKDCDE